MRLSRERLSITIIALCSCILFGCASVREDIPDGAGSALKIAVGPVLLEAPITKSAQVHSFDEPPSPETEPEVLAQLIGEIETSAQQILTDKLAAQGGMTVVPFEETRRVLSDMAAVKPPLSEAQIRELGSRTGADIVITGLIHDYGAVRWQYWVTGWLTHASLATTIVGAATAWNPAAIGAYVAFDVTTDLPIWWGGASAFGLAFRPVRVHLDTTQLTNCEGPIWTEEELALRVRNKILAEYPKEERAKKEVQLEANLKLAMQNFAETAGEKLRIQPCGEDGKPEAISNLSVLGVLDLLY
jgi:hypothetical protein